MGRSAYICNSKNCYSDSKIKKKLQKALNIFKSTLYVDGIDLKYKLKPTDNYYWFKERFEGIRFDNIAWALQKYTEDILVTWITNAIKKFRINTIVISGGVAMNIKAMGEISKIKSVNKLFVAGSGSDESLAIGLV